MAEALNVMALVKADQQYVITYEDGDESAAILSVLRWANNLKLNFTMKDYRSMQKRIIAERDKAIVESFKGRSGGI